MTLVLILFLAGVLLLFTEFFVPGIVLGLTGGILVVTSIVIGWSRFPEYGVFILTGEVLGVAIILGLGLYLLAKTRLGRGFVMQATQNPAEGYTAFAQDATLVGQSATVHTALRPAGSIMIGGRKIDAVSNGTLVDAGKTVRITRVEGNRVVCEELTAPAGERSAG